VLDALPEILTIQVLIAWLLGMLFGIFVGSTPGLTATMAVALIVPLSFALDTNAALAMIIGVSFTAIFSGDIPATYLRIPGTPASAAATLDGHQLARKGLGRFALRIDLICSCLGGLIGVILLATLAPRIAKFALRFSHFEDFWLAILGLSLSALVSRGNVLKGILAAVIGLLLATVGMDPITNQPRLTFGFDQLRGGLHFIPVMIGLFGVAEVLRNVKQSIDLSAPARHHEHHISLWKTLGHVLRRFHYVVLSAFTGTMIGALPGAGADVAAWGSYGLAQKVSKRPRKFGHGSIEGVIAPTSANNAAVAGAWIPALVFGLPGDAVTAIVIGAFRVYEIHPGPKLFEDPNSKLPVILLIALLTQFLLIPIGLLGIYAFGFMMRMPRSIILTLVMVFSVIGAYAIRNSMFDVYVMLGFGVFGYFIESQKVPAAPLILGLILGSRVEETLRTGLISSGGDASAFFTRPICAVMIGLLVFAFCASPTWRLSRRLLRSGKRGA
jgi:putative tricarboxylic transport membrane protein